MAKLDKLPRTGDELLDLAAEFGDRALFQFIGWLRDPATEDVTLTRQVLAARLVKAAMENNPRLDFNQAR